MHLASESGSDPEIVPYIEIHRGDHYALDL